VSTIHIASPHRSGRWQTITPIVLAALFLVGGGNSTFAQTSEAAIIEAFTESARQYALLHRRAEAALPPVDRGADLAAITDGITRLASVIRVERRNARQGDLLTPAIAPLLRERIAAALAEHEVSVADLLAAEAAAGVDGPLVPLNVNDSFPWRYATGMLPCLIEALPELPPELQYRIVGYTLVLVDVHASLIVDLLPDALQATELR
jgi:hypothetical protein